MRLTAVQSAVFLAVKLLFCPAPDWLPTEQAPNPPPDADGAGPERRSMFAVPRRLFLALAALAALLWAAVLAAFGVAYVRTVYVNYARTTPSFFTAENCLGGLGAALALMVALSAAAAAHTATFTRPHSTAWAALTLLALALGGAATGGHVFLGGAALPELALRLAALAALVALLPCAATFRPDRLALVEPAKRVPLALPPTLLALLLAALSLFALLTRAPARLFHATAFAASLAALAASVAGAWGVVAYTLRRLAAPLVVVLAAAYTLLSFSFSVAAMEFASQTALGYAAMAVEAGLVAALFAQLLSTFFHPEELTWTAFVHVSLPPELQHKYGAAFAFARLDEGRQCAICMGDFESAVQGACRHVFCRECIARWLADHNSCPLCRAPLVLEELAQAVPWPDERGVELRPLGAPGPGPDPPATAAAASAADAPAAAPRLPVQEERLEEISPSARLLQDV